jgi:hypothetical protein
MVDPKDIATGKNLSRSFAGTSEAVTRSLSPERVVVAWSDEIGDRDAIDGVGVPIVCQPRDTGNARWLVRKSHSAVGCDRNGPSQGSQASTR